LDRPWLRHQALGIYRDSVTPHIVSGFFFI
jgi:hypothetical protein